MKVLFVTDGNNEIGLGHIYQSKTLAHYIQSRYDLDFEISFITKSEEKVNAIISRDCFPVHKCSNDAQIYNLIKKENPVAVIYDKLDLAPELVKQVKLNTRVKQAVFTCITDANEYADITVMGAMGSHFSNIRNDRNGQVNFFGPKYLILRPEFYGISSPKMGGGKYLNINVITLLFGGADPAGLTCKALIRLLKNESDFYINIIIGNAFNNSQQLYDIIKSNKKEDKVRVLRNIRNVQEVLTNSDLVFVSPGISFFETMKVGVPAIIFCQNDFQRTAWKGDIDVYDSTQVSLIDQLIEQKSFIYPAEPLIANMHIGEGVNEIINEILL